MVKRTRGAAGAAGLLLLGAVGLPGCESKPAVAPPGAGSDEWIVGSAGDRFRTVARHLRGLDVAMIEIGYRYNELYFAGEDENWSFAVYQVHKMRTALALAVERRPTRAESAKMMDQPLVDLETAAMRGDAASFRGRFENLTTACNACHEAEKFGWARIVPPTVRTSPVRAALRPDAGAAAAGRADGGAPSR